jgi:protein KRI1
LAYLKSKDPKKYEEIPTFFKELETVEETVKSKKKPKVKPMTIKDFERKIILEHDGKYDESDDEENQVHARPESPTIIEEQEQLRNSIKNALKDSDDSDAEDENKMSQWGNMFKKRVKTREEMAAEEETYLTWLADRRNFGESIKNEDRDQLNPLKEYWSSKKLEKDDAFLKDYILNKRFIENNEIPTYDEIVGGPSEDEQELERQEEYEHQYNFRYEEPDTEFIKRFPRVIENSVRVTADSKRKEQRADRKERKQREKEEKLRDLEELKKIKQQEIKERIEKLKQIAGNDHMVVNEDELDTEFDPAEHDRKMAAMFDDEYYMIDEGEEKPECADLEKELDIENWDNIDRAAILSQNDDDVDHCEDDEFNMDVDYDPEAAKRELQKEMIDSTKGKRKRRKRLSKFAENLKEEKPVFDPEDEKTFAEYIDEYYKLEYEDIIADQPCRFKYTETVPNDFGLSVEEVCYD